MPTAAFGDTIHCSTRHRPLSPLMGRPSASIYARGPVLFKIIPVVVQCGDVSIATYAFVDEGSSVTLIDATLAEDLNVHSR